MALAVALAEVAQRPQVIGACRVSPGTVERAVQALRAEGYLKTVMGRGLFVRPLEERQR